MIRSKPGGGSTAHVRHEPVAVVTVAVMVRSSHLRSGFRDNLT